MLAQIDYRKRRYYHKDLHTCKSHENRDGDGIMIGHSQMGEVEIPMNVAVEIFTNYLQEHGYAVVALGGAKR